MKKIVILEDNEDRCAVMRDCLRDRFHQYEAVFFRDAAEARAYLREHLGEAILISLDHDLELLTERNGKPVDPGSGREVADFLATQPPACPIVIATTNSAAGDGMEYLLSEARWETFRVYPWGDLEWIGSQWFRTVRNAIVGSAKLKKMTDA